MNYNYELDSGILEINFKEHFTIDLLPGILTDILSEMDLKEVETIRDIYLNKDYDEH